MSSSSRRDLMLRLWLFGALGVVVYFLWPFLWGVPPVGPTVVKTDLSGNVWVLLNRSLHSYDRNGQPGPIFDFDEKVKDEVSDFVVSPEGDVYLAERGTRTIWKFGSDGQPKGHLSLPAIPGVKTGTPEHPMSPKLVQTTSEDGKPVTTQSLFSLALAADWDGGRLFVAESGHHRIHILDLSSGKLIETLGEAVEKPFHYPNVVRSVGDTLYVSNTRMKSIYERTGTSTHALAVARDAETPVKYPTFFDVKSDGTIAVLVNKTVMGQFQGVDVAFFGPSGDETRRVEIPEGVLARGVVFLGDDLLLADFEGWQILKLDASGQFTPWVVGLDGVVR